MLESFKQERNILGMTNMQLGAMANVGIPAMLSDPQVEQSVVMRATTMKVLVLDS